MRDSEREKLQAAHVRELVVELERRIAARFPERGLRGTARDLLAMLDTVAGSAGQMHRQLAAARLTSRVLILLILAGTVVALGLAGRSAVAEGVDNGLDWLPLIETTINDVVFAAIAVFFLHSIPERMQRRSFLELLHGLRSLAHVIDMHQLNKDPERLRDDYVATSESPVMGLTKDELEHYLDHCSELLSLVGKTAALCAEESQDDVVLTTVSTIETLTTGMSRKIWQKISVLNTLR